MAEPADDDIPPCLTVRQVAEKLACSDAWWDALRPEWREHYRARADMMVS